MKTRVNIDGGSRGNPGPSACAFVINTGINVVGEGFFLGTMTNNQAEYSGLIRALKKLNEMGIDSDIQIISDSELLVKQLNGMYKVKSENIMELYRESQNIIKGMSGIEIIHVKRDKNKTADMLLNEVLDSRENIH